LKYTRVFSYELLVPVNDPYAARFELPPTVDNNDDWVNWYKDSIMGKSLQATIKK